MFGRRPVRVDELSSRCFPFIIPPRRVSPLYLGQLRDFSRRRRYIDEVSAAGGRTASLPPFVPFRREGRMSRPRYYDDRAVSASFNTIRLFARVCSLRAGRSSSPRLLLMTLLFMNCPVTLGCIIRTSGHACSAVQRERGSRPIGDFRARSEEAEHAASFPHRLLTARSRANRATSDSPRYTGISHFAFTIAIHARRDSRVYRITCIIIGEWESRAKSETAGGRRRCYGGISGMWRCCLTATFKPFSGRKSALLFIRNRPNQWSRLIRFASEGSPMASFKDPIGWVS